MLKAQLPFLPNFYPKNPSPRGLAVPGGASRLTRAPASAPAPAPPRRAGGSARGRGGHGGAAAAAGPPGAAGRCGAGGAAESEWGRGRGEPGGAAGLSTAPVRAAAGLWDSDGTRGNGAGDGDHRSATAVLPVRVPRGAKWTQAELDADPFSCLEGSCVGNTTQKLVRLSEICRTTQPLLVTTF